jgi:hypothetical protein
MTMKHAAAWLESMLAPSLQGVKQPWSIISSGIQLWELSQVALIHLNPCSPKVQLKVQHMRSLGSKSHGETGKMAQLATQQAPNSHLPPWSTLQAPVTVFQLTGQGTTTPKRHIVHQEPSHLLTVSQCNLQQHNLRVQSMMQSCKGF